MGLCGGRRAGKLSAAHVGATPRGRPFLCAGGAPTGSKPRLLGHITATVCVNDAPNAGHGMTICGMSAFAVAIGCKADMACCAAYVRF
jgi:hypothetical protein